jgi:hypothetical protein
MPRSDLHSFSLPCRLCCATVLPTRQADSSAGPFASLDAGEKGAGGDSIAFEHEERAASVGGSVGLARCSGAPMPNIWVVIVESDPAPARAIRAIAERGISSTCACGYN